ncbi:hypothetical protein [Collinsella vaginalis]|uniref:hypothetical protein n=1 Tax=Collinsella vaginalis TaxID=1870987 RepID=UPI00117CB0B1|nr:hypothetical protein [Collinsella vaginalis]
MERGLSLSHIAVIAASPLDTAAMLEAGCALALVDAGYEACRAADAVFPARAEGGLQEALAFVLAACDWAGAPVAHDPSPGAQQQGFPARVR